MGFIFMNIQCQNSLYDSFSLTLLQSMDLDSLKKDIMQGIVIFVTGIR